MSLIVDPAIAFRVPSHAGPALEVRVNFGVYAGRNATAAEIDDLAHLLRTEVPAFAVIAEARHEFGGDVETSLHQVVIEVDRQNADDLRTRRASGSSISPIAGRPRASPRARSSASSATS